MHCDPLFIFSVSIDTRQLCVCVDAHLVYCTLSDILHSEEQELAFVSLMVQVLNMILFTASELYDLRMQLKDLATPVCCCMCSISFATIV